MVADSLVGRAAVLVWRQAGAVFRGIRRIDAALGHIPLPKPDPDDEQRVQRVLASSRLVTWVDAALDVPPRAWRSSAVRRWAQPSIDAVRHLPAAERLRLSGATFLVATLTHIGLVLAVAEPVGWATWVGWVSFLGAAVFPVCWPAEVLAAWSTSRLRRRMRRDED
jgi:hypothetical protein